MPKSRFTAYITKHALTWADNSCPSVALTPAGLAALKGSGNG